GVAADRQRRLDLPPPAQLPAPDVHLHYRDHHVHHRCPAGRRWCPVDAQAGQGGGVAMPATVLLDGVLVGLGIAMVVLAVAPVRAKGGGIAGATAVIEQRYAQQAGTEETQVPTAPPWLAGIGRRLSPAGTIAK